MLFHIIPDVQCIVRSKGVYQQVPVYRRYDQVFIKWKGGYIRLFGSGGTSAPNVSWEEMEHSELISFNKMGSPLVALPEVKQPEQLPSPEK